MTFFPKIGIFYKSIAGLLSEAKRHWMVNWLQFLNQFDFVWRQTKVFIQKASQCCLQNVQLLSGKLMLMAPHAHFLPQQQYSRVYALFLGFHALVSRWGCQFLSLFFQECLASSKIRTQFSHTFCNIIMIFKVILQYFPTLFKRIHNHIRSAEE